MFDSVSQFLLFAAENAKKQESMPFWVMLVPAILIFFVFQMMFGGRNRKEQKKKAEESLAKEQENYEEKIVTEILPVAKYYKAEEYHQKYLKKSGRNVC